MSDSVIELPLTCTRRQARAARIAWQVQHGWTTAGEIRAIENGEPVPARHTFSPFELPATVVLARIIGECDDSPDGESVAQCCRQRLDELVRIPPPGLGWSRQG